ncbi:MAG: hypothetical protein DA408_02460 [Bacteroidetes bacterium]|nr:MAG: hypothetical protein C7N36_09880 [Bacteroidota bacterium]PTM14671.1 MAG: hypothetical protein DA408_02460 [Bacteroidota bacterium]
MRISLLFLFFLYFIPFNSQAQKLLLLEPAVIKKQLVIQPAQAGQEEVLKVTVTNPTQRTLRLRWDKAVEYQPFAWESQLCDKEASYPPQVTSNYNPIQGIVAPVVLAPGESFELYLTLLMYNVPGQGKIEVFFREISRPDEIIGTAVFQVNLLDAKDAAVFQDKNQRARVFPNPVYDRFFLANAPANCARIDIYNTLGRRVKTYDKPELNDSYDATDLPQGVYLVSLLDANGKVLRTLRMLRRDFRP